MSETIDDSSKSFDTQLFRYALVGGVALLADLGVLVTLTEMFGVHYLVSAVFGFGVGVTVNYLLSVLWVFTDHALQSRWLEFAVFLVLGIMGLGLNEISLYVLSGVLGAHYVLAKFAATVLTFFWNFGSRKMLLFSIARPCSDRVLESERVEVAAQPVAA